jgi:hypothetical protein
MYSGSVKCQARSEQKGWLARRKRSLVPILVCIHYGRDDKRNSHKAGDQEAETRQPVQVVILSQPQSCEPNHRSPKVLIDVDIYVGLNPTWLPPALATVYSQLFSWLAGSGELGCLGHLDHPLAGFPPKTTLKMTPKLAAELGAPDSAASEIWECPQP